MLSLSIHPPPFPPSFSPSSVFIDSLASSQSDHSLGISPLPPSSSSSSLTGAVAALPPPPSHCLVDLGAGSSQGWPPPHPPDSQASPSIGAGVPPISSFDAIIPGLSLPPPKSVLNIAHYSNVYGRVIILSTFPHSFIHSFILNEETMCLPDRLTSRLVYLCVLTDAVPRRPNML